MKSKEKNGKKREMKKTKKRWSDVGKWQYEERRESYIRRNGKTKEEMRK